MVFCNKPWREIHYYSSGVVGSCCRKPAGPHLLGALTDDPLEVWGGERFNHLRKLVQEDKVWEAGCGTCVDLSCDVVKESFPVVREEHGFPQHVFLQLSYLCNLHCSHCCQGKERRESPVVMQEFPVSVFKRVYDAFFQDALNFIFIGGEALANPNFPKLLAVMHPGENPGCRVNVVTNGLLLRDNLPLFTRFPNFNIHVSVDAANEPVYRRIRGASWRRLRMNLEAYRCWADRNGLEWSMILNFLLMHSNIHQVPKMLDLAEELGAEASFGMVYGCFKHENLFLYRELRDTAWETAIDMGVEKLRWKDELWARNAVKNLLGAKHYLLQPGVSIHDSDSKAVDYWNHQVCSRNGVVFKPERLRRAAHLLREGKVKHLAKRVLARVIS